MVRGLLVVVASPGARALGSGALGAQAQWLQSRAPERGLSRGGRLSCPVEASQSKDGTPVSCVGSWILNLWTTTEALLTGFKGLLK